MRLSTLRNIRRQGLPRPWGDWNWRRVQLSPQVLSGFPIQPQFHADAMAELADDGCPMPNDIIAVKKAKARREVLLRYKAIYEGSKKPNQADLTAERQNILEKRRQLDDTMAKRLRESEVETKKRGGTQKARTVEEYRQEEQKNRNIKQKAYHVGSDENHSPDFGHVSKFGLKALRTRMQ